MKFELTAKDYLDAAREEARLALWEARRPTGFLVARFHRNRAIEYRAKGRELLRQERAQAAG